MIAAMPPSRNGLKPIETITGGFDCKEIVLINEKEIRK